MDYVVTLMVKTAAAIKSKIGYQILVLHYDENLMNIHYNLGLKTHDTNTTNMHDRARNSLGTIVRENNSRCDPYEYFND